MEDELARSDPNYLRYRSDSGPCTTGLPTQVVVCEQTVPHAVEVTLNTLCACASKGSLTLLDGTASVHATLPAQQSGPTGTVKFLVWPSREGTKYRFSRQCALRTGLDTVDFTVCCRKLAGVTVQASGWAAVVARPTRYELNDFALRAGSISIPTCPTCPLASHIDTCLRCSINSHG